MAMECNERTSGTEGGEIIAFPLAARAGDVERCARELDGIHGGAAVDYWKAECRRLARQLSTLGLPEEEIRHQILTFQAEVQIAMAERYRTELAERSRSDSRT